MLGAGAFLQQLSHDVSGKVVGVGHLLRREVVDEVAVAPAPALERHAVLAGAVQALLDGLMGQPGQLLQLRNQRRPTAFADPDHRDARVVDVVQLMVAVRVLAGDARRRQGPGGAPPDDRDSLRNDSLPESAMARLTRKCGQFSPSWSRHLMPPENYKQPKPWETWA